MADISFSVGVLSNRQGRRHLRIQETPPAGGGRGCWKTEVLRRSCYLHCLHACDIALDRLAVKVLGQIRGGELQEHGSLVFGSGAHSVSLLPRPACYDCPEPPPPLARRLEAPAKPVAGSEPHPGLSHVPARVPLHRQAGWTSRGLIGQGPCQGRIRRPSCLG